MNQLFGKVGERIAAEIRGGPISRKLEELLVVARSRYRRLEPRERRLVSVALVLLAVVLVYNLAYLPLANFQSSLDSQLEARQRELAEVQRLVDTYRERQAELRAAEKNTVPQSRDFSLFSVIETALTRNVGHDRISSITPGAERKLSGGLTQYTVDLKLEKVSLAQIVDALYGVKTLSVPVAVSNLRITRRVREPHSYDVDMTCIAVAKNG